MELTDRWTSSAGRAGATLLRSQQVGLVAVLLVLGATLTAVAGSHPDRVTGATINNFLNVHTLIQMATDASSFAIMGVGATIVIVSGGIDLSVGAIYALAGVTAAHLALSAPPAVAILAGLAVGLVVGLVNGVVTTFFRINSLIATLAMSFVVAGLDSLVTGGNLIILYSHPSFGDLARTSFLSVNTSTWIMVIAVVLLAIVLARTTAGRYMYAAGGNAEAARLAGVRVQLIKVSPSSSAAARPRSAG